MAAGATLFGQLVERPEYQSCTPRCEDAWSLDLTETSLGGWFEIRVERGLLGGVFSGVVSHSWVARLGLSVTLPSN